MIFSQHINDEIEALGRLGFEFEIQQKFLQTTVEGRNENLKVSLFMTATDDTSMICYATFPEVIPATKQTRMLPFLNTLNRRIWYGFFDLRKKTGFLNFRTDALMYEGIVSQRRLLNLIEPCWQTMDRYLPSIHAYLNEDITVEEALALVTPE